MKQSGSFDGSNYMIKDYDIDLHKSYCSNTLLYQHKICSGFLKKQPENKQIWSSSTYKRYFVLDHIKKVLIIYKVDQLKNTRDSTIKHQQYIAQQASLLESNIKRIPYEDLQMVKPEDPEYQIVYDEESQTAKAKKVKKAYSAQVKLPWSFQFSLLCKEREYVLFSASEDERTLWVFTFTWIIKESLRLQ